MHPVKKKVLLIGPIPPPAGGVSIHITRLSQLLKDEFSVKLVDESHIPKDGILNLRRLNPGAYLSSIFRSNIVHIHSGPKMLKYAHILFSRLMGKKTVLTIHSLKQKGSFLDGLVYSLPHVTIVVNSDFRQRVRLSNRVLVKDAFLPPVAGNEPKLPETIENWVHEKKAGGYIVACANAWRLDTHNGEDLYGLDLCIDAAISLRANGRKIGFVFVVCDLGGHIDIAKYEALIEQHKLSDIFFLQKSQISFINLVKECDIVLRPTNTDGDALTVREALFLNKAVIASNVVARPPGTILFETRNRESLVTSLAETASNIHTIAQSATEPFDYHKFYKEIYTTLN
jgi:glycosyltransferase involved in cell wall biosynthesis